MFKNIKTAEDLAAEQFETLRNQMLSAVQRHLDEVAQTRNYDNILSMCTYATSTNSVFMAEGQAGVEWRDSVWAYCYQELDRVVAGERATPTEAELLAELPVISWP